MGALLARSDPSGAGRRASELLRRSRTGARSVQERTAGGFPGETCKGVSGGGAGSGVTVRRIPGRKRLLRYLAGRPATLKGTPSFFRVKILFAVDPSRFAETPFGSARRTLNRHGYVAYFPHPIPRSVEISAENLVRLADAEAALGCSRRAVRLLPHPHLLVRPYLRREAVASTRNMLRTHRAAAK